MGIKKAALAAYPQGDVNGLAFAVRCYLHRRPSVAWLCCWWKWPVIRHRGVVRLFATAGTNFLEYPAPISGVFTRFFRHMILLS